MVAYKLSVLFLNQMSWFRGIAKLMGIPVQVGGVGAP